MIAEEPRICIHCGLEIYWSGTYSTWKHYLTNVETCLPRFATPYTKPVEQWTENDWEDFREGLNGND